MNEGPPVQNRSLSVLLLVLIGIAVAFLIILSIVFLQMRKPAGHEVNATLPAPPSGKTAAREISNAQDLSPTNAVTIQLGDDESSQGLTLVKERDGHTDVESINGVSARVARLSGTKTELYFYFRIDPAFKLEDVRNVRFDVEYLDPQPGRLLIHYDALDAPNARSRAYRDVTPQSVPLTGSGAWQHATFHTRKDGAFGNRQNGKSDFRLCAQTPSFYVRRVTVTREPAPADPFGADFSTSNSVSLILGEEKSLSGLRHLSGEADGRTIITNLDEVLCRYLNRTVERRPWGEFYFDIAPSFKRDGLFSGRVEIEYLSPHTNSIRLQFDGILNGRNAPYVPVLPEGTVEMRQLFRNFYSLPASNGMWTVATFQITNATFRNSQNGGADFRLEVVPPELYVRRITLTRGSF